MDEAAADTLAGPAPVPRLSDRLAGKVCLVTGGGSGIGRATALRMALEGAAAVVVAGRRPDTGEAVAAEVRAKGAEGMFTAADVTQEADVAALVAATVRHFGRLDAVFNNAGFQERRAPLAEQDDATYARVFDTNVRALLHGLRHQIPAMLAGGGGAIVNNASVSGVRNPNPGLSLYSASKAAAISLTRSAAMEYASQGVRINAVAPGRVVTGMMLASGIADMSQVAAGLPLRRMGRPRGGRGGSVLAAVGRSKLHRGACAVRRWRLPGGVGPRPHRLRQRRTRTVGAIVHMTFLPRAWGVLCVCLGWARSRLRVCLPWA